MRLELEFIAKTTGGRIFGDDRTQCDGVCVDSRSVRDRQLFVALQGEHADGHAFAARALKTAAAAMVSKPMEADGPWVVVGDTLRALQDLGRGACRRLNPMILAATGSVGKSTAKELAAASLALAVPGVAASKGNLNSTIGVPLSVCNLPDDTRWAVLEMGINKPGEMRALGAIAPPDVILFTGVHPVHTAFFESLETIAREKASLAEFLKPEGAVCFPAGDPRLTPLLAPLPCRKITFGPGGDVQAVLTEDRGFLGYAGVIRIRDAGTPFSVPHAALHVETVLQVAAALHAFGIGAEAVARAAHDFTPMAGRLNLLRTERGLTLVDDCYNASPFALEVLLARFAKTPVPGKRILVLGDMLELGALEERAHREAGAAAARVVDALITLGPRAALAARAFAETGKAATACDTVGAAAEAVLSMVAPGDWIVLKASRGVALERLIPLLENAHAV